MTKNCCCNLTNYWKTGNYTSTTSSAEGLLLSTGNVTIKYLYNCCNKVCGVQISAVVTTTTTPPLTGTFDYYYYCNGNFKYTDSLGSNFSGKWIYKSGRICTLINGTDKFLNLPITGKITDSKTTTGYLTDIYYNKSGKCTLQYRYTLTPKTM